MPLNQNKTAAQRKAEGLRRLTQAYSKAVKEGTVRKVVTLPKHLGIDAREQDR